MASTYIVYIVHRVKGKDKGLPITRHDDKEGQWTYNFTFSLSTWGWAINAMHRPLYPPSQETQDAL